MRWRRRPRHNAFDWLCRTAQMVHPLKAERKPPFNSPRSTMSRDAQSDRIPSGKRTEGGGRTSAEGSPGQPCWLVARSSPVRLLYGLEQFRERDAQRTRQTKKVLEGRVPASG